MDILFEELPGRDGALGMITLNRQQVLNALSHEMFFSLTEYLTRWAKSEYIKAVVIKAAPGRAFCAGGDIRHAYQGMMNQDPTLSKYFGDEYRLNSLIYHYPKPYIALLDGITMGGGAGISIHGSHRVATEHLIFAMPETAIGFFPDVGSTYFLPRLPGKIGMYLGLTGARLNGEDCFAIGLAQHFVSRDALPNIISDLADAHLTYDTVTEILNQFNQKTLHAPILQQQNLIEQHFNKNSMEEIVHSLSVSKEEWSQQTAATLATKSPTSLKVTFRQLQMGRDLSFDECMNLEYCLVNHFILSHDFREGVRAVIIDKDKNPRWRPEKLEEVTEKRVDEFFALLSGSFPL